MNRRHSMRCAGLAVVLVAALLLAPAALARGPELLRQVATYDLSWWTVDGGGGASGGAEYVLSSTAGQHDAAPPVSQGGYTLSAGFWSGTRIEYRVNLPLALWISP